MKYTGSDRPQLNDLVIFTDNGEYHSGMIVGCSSLDKHKVLVNIGNNVNKIYTLRADQMNRQVNYREMKLRLDLEIYKTIIHEVYIQATRKNRASEDKQYLVTDLDIIESLCKKVLPLYAEAEEDEYFAMFSPRIQEIIGVCHRDSEDKEPDCIFIPISQEEFECYGEVWTTKEELDKMRKNNE